MLCRLACVGHTLCGQNAITNNYNKQSYLFVLLTDSFPFFLLFETFDNFRLPNSMAFRSLRHRPRRVWALMTHSIHQCEKFERIKSSAARKIGKIINYHIVDSNARYFKSVPFLQSSHLNLFCLFLHMEKKTTETMHTFYIPHMCIVSSFLQEKKEKYVRRRKRRA